jgi:hypothetical protein
LVDVTAVPGPLDARRLQWIAELYGAVDPKYRDRAQLEHLFLASPAGPGLHAFALDGERPVGHCAVVPMTARRDGLPLLVGKVEALVVAAPYRGRRDGAPPLAVELRERLYALADERGIEVLHAYVRPAVGRVLDLVPVRAGPRSFVAVLRPDAVAGKARVPAAGLAVIQGGLRAIARPLARSRFSVRRVDAEDRDLVQGPPAASGAWTVCANDVWAWCREAPALRVLAMTGSDRGRALVQLPGGRGDALRVVAWRSDRPTLRGAIGVAAAAARLAHDQYAGRVVYQPWSEEVHGRTLAHACRLLGFVEREDFATLYVRGRDPALAQEVATTPLLALGF